MATVMAARRHSWERGTTSEIADELGVSRFEVARMLDEAVERGIVTFEIHSPADVHWLVTDVHTDRELVDR